jgi:hypothetical protein
VALHEHGNQEPLATQLAPENQLAVPFGPVGAGLYDLKVRGIDRRGLPGAWSPSIKLRVIGVALPNGAYVSNLGVIHLGPGQQAQFTHTEGVELTYSGAHRYFRGGSLVPLHRNARTMVSFRLPGSPDVAVAKLQPRAVSAEVTIGPKLARWPRDDIEVSVRLQRTDGAPAPSFIEARPRVMIGIDPVEVQWRREGELLLATIPPSKKRGRGPWVVRVEVEDQFGVPLGRDFLEVATSR